jgi:hypothetical protein
LATVYPGYFPSSASIPRDEATMAHAAVNAPMRDRMWIERLIGLVLLAMIFGQKLGVPAAGSHVELVLILTYGVLGVLLLRDAIMVSATRLLLLAILLAAMMLSQWMSQQHWALTAALIVLALYCPFVFVLPVSRESYRRILNIFQRGMLVVCAIVAAQQLAQFTIGSRYWLDLNAMMPAKLLVPGYNYLRETSYGSGIFMPNGIFFLEPSIVSQFLAIALIVEIAMFRRLLWMVAFAAGLLLTLAGSGLLVLALSLPFAIVRLGKRVLPFMLAALVVILPVAQAVGWVDQIAARANEFTQPGTSGYIRYTQPLAEMTDRLTTRSEQLVTGAGAGSTLNDPGHNSLGLTKLVNEYGLVVGIAFYAFILACIFASAPSLAIAWGVFMFYMIGGGGLSVGIYALPLLFFASLMRIEDGDDEAEDAGQAAPRLEPALS